MADIQVFLPKGGHRFVVLNEHEAVMPKEGVHWHFQVEDPNDIGSVEITFKKANATYFRISSAAKKFTNTFVRDLADGDTIYGLPPRRPWPKSKLLKGNLSQVPAYRDSYTIKGFKNGKQVAFVDPEIVPIKP